MTFARHGLVLLALTLTAACGGADVGDVANRYLAAVRESASSTDPSAVRVLEDARQGMPEGAAVTGVVDDDGDGHDDDRRVSVNLDEAWACITLPSKQTTGDVTGGACS